MDKDKAVNQDVLVALRRVEGQIRGVHQMIRDNRYCMEVLYALGASIGALKKIEGNILNDHLNICVKSAFVGKSQKEKERKIEEICEFLQKA